MKVTNSPSIVSAVPWHITIFTHIFHLHQLKSVAIKLKKRVAELTAQLSAAEEARSKALAERHENGSKDNVKAAKTIQARTLRVKSFSHFS